MNSRLSQFLSAENLTQAQFADTIGVSRSNISHIMSGRNKPSYEIIAAMMEHYPALNYEWLILGKGRMYQSNPKAASAAPAVTMGVDTSDLLFPEEFAGEGGGASKNENPANAPGTAAGSIAAPSPVTESSSKGIPSSASPALSPSTTTQSPVSGQGSRRIVKIIALFEDGSYQQLG